MNPEKERQGFAYVTVLVMIFVSGISLSGASAYWRTVMKQERETELLCRGRSIQQAIASYVRAGGGAYPEDLEDLLRDPRFPGIRRHIRKIYPDPMTADGQWGLIWESDHGIRGVHSLSGEPPLKRGNFPPEYLHFEDAHTYSDWQFVHISDFGRTKPAIPENRNREEE